MKPSRRKFYLITCLSILAIGLTTRIVAHLGAEIFWFEEVGYLPVYLLRVQTQGISGVVAFTLSAIYLLGNLALAQRFSSHFSPKAAPSQPAFLKLRWLLCLTVSLSLLVGLIFSYYLQAVVVDWRSDAHAPMILGVTAIGQLLNHGWVSVGFVGLAIAIQLYPQRVLKLLALLLSVSISWVVSQQWVRILPYFQPTAFKLNDPVFGKDISNYIFSLPVGELIRFGLMGISLYGFVAVTLVYLLTGDSLSEGKFLGFSPHQQRHLAGLAGVLMLVVGFHYWLSGYELLYSLRGVSFGASYTDITIQLPADRALQLLSLAVAIYLFCRSIYPPRSGSYKPILAICSGYLVAIIISTVLPLLVQILVVQPNELAKETPYLERSIALTRQAFGLDNIDIKTFDPQANLTESDIQANDSTIQNIRLWDKQPLLDTNRQLQQIRLYYRFPDADIDRYPLNPDAPTEQQQVLIAARELDYTAVPKQAQTWVNEHLTYTHGYGFTMNPVNRVADGGLPEYLVKDIGMNRQEAIRANIPIGQPRIYYGEATNTYIMTSTKVKELDYPSGNENVYNVYDGRGGIKLDSFWRKLLFAIDLDDWRMALTPEFLPDTKLLFRRNLTDRISAIAPFLKFDRDPYLVSANVGDTNSLYWIIDAYTTSDRYPYSDTGKEGINYIRNSVKVVIDAYHGSVKFYINDATDPIVTTWAKIFPTLFQPLNSIPENLRRHLRYPTDFFTIQSERLMTYHMTDPRVFYSREDRWQIPTEVYGNQPKLVEPYYLITKLPTLSAEEFILFLPYTPQQRTNSIAWLAARSDGENYGKLSLYTFPKQRLIYGPEQIEARINQDPVISQQISLWNRQGSRVIQGNLLIVPIEQSLLYVEPLYLEATQNQLPTLVRVIVAYENRIVMAQTLQQALTAIFKPSPPPPPIIRQQVD